MARPKPGNRASNRRAEQLRRPVARLRRPTHVRVHDASYESALRQAGFQVTIVRNQGKGDALLRVEAARRLFPNMWFDAEKCAAGLEALGAYHERKDEVRGIGLGAPRAQCHATARGQRIAILLLEKRLDSGGVGRAARGHHHRDGGPRVVRMTARIRRCIARARRARTYAAVTHAPITHGAAGTLVSCDDR